MLPHSRAATAFIYTYSIPLIFVSRPFEPMQKYRLYFMLALTLVIVSLPFDLYGDLSFMRR